MTSKIPKPYIEERPWGNFIEFSKNEPSTIKIITIKPQSALSLQSHTLRDEFWHIISGNGQIIIDEKIYKAQSGNEFFIPRQAKHRIETDLEPLIILEISFGMFNENDITRFEDRYGRVTK